MLQTVITIKRQGELIFEKDYTRTTRLESVLLGFIQSKAELSQGIDKNQTDMQALDSMIQLVDNWLKDDSGYDEEIYPLIEASLTQD